MKHIPGKYAKERAKKSEIVNCLVVGLLHYIIISMYGL